MNIQKRILYLLILSLLISNALVPGLSKSVFEKSPSWIVDAERSDDFDQSLGLTEFENRVMFDEDIWWALSRENTDKIIRDLVKAGINVYIPCVWHGRGAHYFSGLVHLDARIQRRFIEGDDPLEYLIQRAHENDIEVHAWLTVVRREDSKLGEFYDSGTPAHAFNVHNEKFRDFIVSLVKEIVDRYPVDGINLDYIRSMGYCTTEQCAKEYRKHYGRSLDFDLIAEKIPKSRIKSIEDWNGSAIDDIVYRVSRFIRDSNPNVIISVDSVPNARHLRMQGHDSQKWLDENWVDVVFYMIYKNDFKVSHVDLAKSNVNKPDAIVPLIALYDLSSLEKKPGDLLARSVRASRHHWPKSGLAFYHYKHFSEDQIKVLRRSVYSTSKQPAWRQ